MLDNIYREFIASTGVNTDSRRIVPGQIFFALHGENFNGNLFAEDALARGARLAVVDDPAMKSKTGCILVQNTLQTLQELARHHRRILGLPVLALTGSNGKTTTKELLARVLGAKFKVGFTRGNLNNHVGVPLTILEFKADTEVGLIEMGANHKGEIDLLTGIAEPDFGLITNIGKAHLEGFGSIEGVYMGKTEMLRHLEMNGGVFFLNADDPWLSKAKPGMKTITYGRSQHLDFRGEVVSSSLGLTVQIEERGMVAVVIESQLTGGYNLHNVLAAYAVGRNFGLPPDMIVSSIESYSPDNNRSQLSVTERNTVVLDAYNANPTSIESALTSFMQMPGERKVVLLGDMFELGSESISEHLNILEMLQRMAYSSVFLIGPRFFRFRNQFEFVFFETTEAAYDHFSAAPLSNSTVLLKGSRGMRLELLIPLL